MSGHRDRVWTISVVCCIVQYVIIGDPLFIAGLRRHFLEWPSPRGVVGKGEWPARHGGRRTRRTLRRSNEERNRKKIGKVTKKGFGVVLLRLILKTPATMLRNTHMRHASLPVSKNRVQMYLFSFISLSFSLFYRPSRLHPFPSPPTKVTSPPRVHNIPRTRFYDVGTQYVCS